MFIRSGFNSIAISITVLALVYFCLVASARADTHQVVIGADPWCPYICDMGEQQQGLMVDIAREALAYSDYEMVYSNINWARTKQMVLAGEIDGLVGLAKVGDRVRRRLVGNVA